MTNLQDAIALCFKGREGQKCRYEIGADFPAFEGHFPSRPLLPAVVQLLFALDALSRIEQKHCALKAVSKAKFNRPVGPESRLTVEILPKGGNVFAAQLLLEGEQKCGQILFEVTTHETH